MLNSIKMQRERFDTAALAGFVTLGCYMVIGPPLGALFIVGPLFAMFGYVAIVPAWTVGVVHTFLLFTVRSWPLRLLAVLTTGPAATTMFFLWTTNNPDGWVHRWLTQDFERVVFVALPPTLTCFLLVEWFWLRAEQRRIAAASTAERRKLYVAADQ